MTVDDRDRLGVREDSLDVDSVTLRAEAHNATSVRDHFDLGNIVVGRFKL